ncbi:MAG TPA: RdgB/HAM1 family non-canonical purine NTP pyrophosphatase [Gammaproteobacteria bacterium]|nr:RdgB/HAM1 family non-canonical purine NTP pyrophosphatase [Gammaproteobacteria bacterium]
MLPARELVLASGNAGKLAEIARLLEPLGLVIRTQTEFGITPPEETGLSFIENAILKARHAARLSGLPALADDSGLEVDFLNGAPGIYSARYAGEDGNDAANNHKLLGALEGVPAGQRSARFRCVIALLRHAEDPMPLVATGTWEGRILEAPRGEGGFGYDPLFLPAGLERTAAELGKAEKNRLSHRGQALQALLALLS